MAKSKERGDAAAEKEHPTEERTTEGTDGTGREGTEKSRENTPVEASNW